MDTYHEAGLYEAETGIEHVDRAGDEIWVELRQSIFYPGGGGQPCDIGRLTADGFDAEVVEVKGDGNRILHKLLIEKGAVKKGMDVMQHIDRGRRIRLSKMHTGEHILFRALQKVIEEKGKNLELKKIDLGTEQSHLFVKTKDLSWEEVFEAELLANDVVQDDVEVKRHEVPKVQIRDFKQKHGLRINEDRIKEDTVFVTELEGFDFSACTGIHVSSTGKAGPLLVTGLNRSHGAWELTYVADALPELLETSKFLRSLSARLEVPPEDVEGRVVNLVEDNEEMKERIRSLSESQEIDVNEESLGKKTLLWSTVELMEQRQLAERANDLLEEREKSLVCLLNHTEGNVQVLLLATKDLNIDVPGILKETLSPLGGKGGGRGEMAMGGLSEERVDEIIPRMISLLQEE